MYHPHWCCRPPQPSALTMQSLWLEEMMNDENNLHSIPFLDSSEDECESRIGGSVPGRAPNVERGREEAAMRLYNDYFAHNPVYSDLHFERRFRVSRGVFHKVQQALEAHDPYFTQRIDCTGRRGLTSYQKMTAALRLLAYGSAADSIDEYVRLGESTALECLERFCEGVVACFGLEYLRSPTKEDLERILARSERRGFPGMMGSIDCAKWVWKNCPTAYHGQYQGKEGVPALTLECIADDHLWIWHLFFGVPGSANDINVLESSTLSDKIANGTYPFPVVYKIAGETRTIPYWLADGIYPKWQCFVQTVSHPTTRKERLMATCQEGARKDVERAFGVLQAKWHIVARPSRFWYKQSMKTIMGCCVILHNMMVENRSLSPQEDRSLTEGGLGVTVRENGKPMWAADSHHSETTPPYGSITAICAPRGSASGLVPRPAAPADFALAAQSARRVKKVY